MIFISRRGWVYKVRSDLDLAESAVGTVIRKLGAHWSDWSLQPLGADWTLLSNILVGIFTWSKNIFWKGGTWGQICLSRWMRSRGVIRWPLKRRPIATTIEIDKTWDSYFGLGGHFLHDLRMIDWPFEIFWSFILISDWQCFRWTFLSDMERLYFGFIVIRGLPGMLFTIGKWQRESSWKETGWCWVSFLMESTQQPRMVK